MLEFTINNFVAIVFTLYLIGNLFYWVYDLYIYKDVPDDWFGALMSYKIAAKSYRRHPEIIGKSIEISKDTNMVVKEEKVDENGEVSISYTRVEKTT
jgi:hypothetical protein